MPAKSCLLSARLRPRVPRSERVSGLAIRMASVLCSSPSAPMLTSLTIQATLPLHQREYRPENTSSGLAPPISRQSLQIAPAPMHLQVRFIDVPAAAHLATPTLPQLLGQGRGELGFPLPDGLIAEHDAADSKHLGQVA